MAQRKRTKKKAAPKMTPEQQQFAVKLGKQSHYDAEDVGDTLSYFAEEILSEEVTRHSIPKELPKGVRTTLLAMEKQRKALGDEMNKFVQRYADVANGVAQALMERVDAEEEAERAAENYQDEFNYAGDI